jgi:acetoin utilization protein AcuB
MSNDLVRDWMTSKPVTVSQNSPIREAYWLMIDNKIRRLPVMHNEQLVGIITLEDLRRAEPSAGIGLDLVKITDILSKMMVCQVMTKDPMTISPDASLIDAARMMLENKISALPVMEGSQLAGIITESDIFRAFVKMEEGNALHNPRDQRK